PWCARCRPDGGHRRRQPSLDSASGASGLAFHEPLVPGGTLLLPAFGSRGGGTFGAISRTRRSVYLGSRSLQPATRFLLRLVPMAQRGVLFSELPVVCAGEFPDHRRGGR